MITELAEVAESPRPCRVAELRMTAARCRQTADVEGPRLRHHLRVVALEFDRQAEAAGCGRCGSGQTCRVP